ncbi:MAG: alpha-rhamnosidase [Clostridia bacterium]|nr:alpha-rhamnosidase [Clostridia bacterium]
MSKSKWIWYPGSFELYHGMLLHNRRTSSRAYEDGSVKSLYYYPMWRVDGPRHNSILIKTAEISKREIIEFYANTELARITVDDTSYPVGAKITLEPGRHTVCVQGFKECGFPCYYIKGNVFASDRTYLVEERDEKAGRHAGESELYTELNDNPEVFKFAYTPIFPLVTERLEGGTLYDFGKESFGPVTVKIPKDGYVDIFLGESREEALDTKYSQIVLNANIEDGSYTSLPVAFRYIYIPNVFDATVTASLEYLPLESKGSFKCDNEEINKLWEVCAYTMLLNSREAFFDGIKRDRWVWGGDAYQSFFVNYYLANDKEIVKRTIRMLRGADPIFKHINTICDYTFLWLCGIWEYYLYTGDRSFLEDIYPEMLDMWNFISGRLDKDSLYERKPDDWVFIDWSTFDSNGPMCAEQMLLCRACQCISLCAKELGDVDTVSEFEKRHLYIKEQINQRYWSDSKGAFIDDYKSGKNNVTRHANIFALLFDYTTNERKEQIIKNVIYNKEITPITTPYFEFYELDAMCAIGDFEYVTNMLDSYFLGMLRLGATTIWEEFDPEKSGIEHYEMYGGKYEKSLCHAWGASPIYLLGKYALGVMPTGVGYKSYIVKPNLMSFNEIEGKVPTPNGEIYVKADKKQVLVLSPISGGTLIIDGKEYEIKKNELLTVEL